MKGGGEVDLRDGMVVLSHAARARRMEVGHGARHSQEDGFDESA